MRSGTRLVIFTALEEALLDTGGSFVAALPALSLLAARGVPLVVCSGKTRGEIELYRRRLGNAHPFVAENGGGVFIPEGYFPSPCARFPSCSVEEEYSVIALGSDYHRLREVMRKMQGRGLAVEGFGDMPFERLVGVTGIPVEEAALAGEREFGEPFLFTGPAERAAEVREIAESEGLTVACGTFLCLQGRTDAGKGVAVLAQLYAELWGDVVTAAVGLAERDEAMLREADLRVVLDAAGEGDRGGVAAARCGVDAWNRGILTLLAKVTGGGS